MNEDFKGLYDVRDSVEADHAFILATFLRGLYYGDSWFSLIPKDTFMNEYKIIANAIVKHPNVIIKVACLREDPSVILGYSILGNNFTTIIYTYVKSNFRKRGIGRSLLPTYPSTVTHLTALGKSLMSKLPKETVFNPFKSL